MGSVRALFTMMLYMKAAFMLKMSTGFSRFSSGLQTSRVRFFKTNVAATMYTIDDSVCPPTNDKILQDIVEKHVNTLDSYLEHKPIAAHTQEAFHLVQTIIENEQLAQTKGLILDSGCGTGRSSLLLGEMYPDSLVIGVDRSIARLTRNAKFRYVQSSNETVKGDSPCWTEQTAESITVQRASSNVVLVRAELVDFWRLALRHNWNVSNHFLLYPNPSPKKARLRQRWYAHPAFPLILKLGRGSIVLRSNWKGYLCEFALSVEMASKVLKEAEPYVASAQKGPTVRVDKTIAWTNFEQKYDDIGEPTYELTLEARLK